MLRVIIKLCEEADTVQRQYDIMLCCFLSYGNTIMSSLTAVNDRENQEITAKNVVIFLTCVQRGMVFLGTSKHYMCFFSAYSNDPLMLWVNDQTVMHQCYVLSVHRNT